MKALIEKKPSPSDKILTDDAAAARYGIAIEAWGERLSRAGARVCRTLTAQGVALPFSCPLPVQP